MMSAKQLLFNVNRKPVLVAAQEALLACFIVLSPVYKCLDITIAGLSPNTILIGLLIFFYALNTPHIISSGYPTFLSFIILGVFCAELVFAAGENHIGWVLSVLLYVCFLQTDERVSFNLLYKSFLIATIVAAFFSLLVGFSGGVMTRTATLVDGSIAPIAITVALFGDNRSEKKPSLAFDILKATSVLSSMVVLALGMSRARFLIVGVCFVLYGVTGLFRLLQNGKETAAKSSILLYGIVTALSVLILLITGILQQFFEPIINRFFNEGLDSMGRDVEKEYGMNMFRAHSFFGGGWDVFTLQDLDGSFVSYNNHNAYIAILSRGGLLMAVPTFLSYVLLFVRALRIRQTSNMAWVLMFVFLALSYGNAGLFNYTICSMIPLVVLDIKRGLNDENP